MVASNQFSRKHLFLKHITTWIGVQCSTHQGIAWNPIYTESYENKLQLPNTLKFQTSIVKHPSSFLGFHHLKVQTYIFAFFLCERK